MRTTLDIDADILGQLKAIAAHSGASLGKTASELLRMALERSQPGAVQVNGLTLFSGPRGGTGPVDLKHINELRDE